MRQPRLVVVASWVLAAVLGCGEAPRDDAAPADAGVDSGVLSTDAAEPPADAATAADAAEPPADAATAADAEMAADAAAPDGAGPPTDAATSTDACVGTIFGPPPCSSDDECTSAYGAGWTCDFAALVTDSCGQEVPYPQCAPRA